MKKRLFALLLFLVLNIPVLVARVGGGSHHHSSHRSHSHHYTHHDHGLHSAGQLDKFHYFGFFALLLLFIVFQQLGYLLILKNKISKIGSLIKISSKRDKIWQEENLQRYVEKTFKRMQDAWTKRDMHLVSDLLTENLYKDFSVRMVHFKQLKQIDYIDRIKIESIKIVGMVDLKDNNRDKFSALIKGTLVNETIREGETPYGYNVSAFEDLYHFVRKENNWLLHEVENELNLWNTLMLKTKLEG